MLEVMSELNPLEHNEKVDQRSKDLIKTSELVEMGKLSNQEISDIESMKSKPLTFDIDSFL